MAGEGSPQSISKSGPARALHFSPSKPTAQDATLITSATKKQKREPAPRPHSQAAKRLEFSQASEDASHYEQLASPELKRRKVQSEQAATEAQYMEANSEFGHGAKTNPAKEAQSANPPRPPPDLPPGVPAPPIPQGRVQQQAPDNGHLPPGSKQKGVLQSIFSPMFHLFNPDDARSSPERTADQGEEKLTGRRNSPKKTGARKSKSPEPAAEREAAKRVTSTAVEAQPDTMRWKSKEAQATGQSRPAPSDGASSTDGGSESCAIAVPSRPQVPRGDAEITEEAESELGEEVYVDDASQEEDDPFAFDPYSFIKSLPPLEQCAPAWRSSLLPKQTRQCKRKTLVLDLDETLVHSTLEGSSSSDFRFEVFFNKQTHDVNVRQRPHLAEFLQRCAELFEVVVFTASQKLYAEQLLNILDPKRKLIRHRIFRDDCVLVEGNYLKDLTVLGRELAHTIIVDNSPQAFGFQLSNGIPIESWYDDPADTELLRLLPFLESLVHVPDVRPLIESAFKLPSLVAKAVGY